MCLFNVYIYSETLWLNKQEVEESELFADQQQLGLTVKMAVLHDS